MDLFFWIHGFLYCRKEDRSEGKRRWADGGHKSKSAVPVYPAGVILLTKEVPFYLGEPHAELCTGYHRESLSCQYNPVGKKAAEAGVLKEYLCYPVPACLYRYGRKREPVHWSSIQLWQIRLWRLIGCFMPGRRVSRTGWKKDKPDAVFIWQTVYLLHKGSGIWPMTM